MTDWLFQCNPNYYRLRDRLADPNPALTWRVQRYAKEIAEGDTVFVWSSRPDPGLYAVLRVDAAPEEMVEPQSERRYHTEPSHAEPELMVRATITDRFPAIPEFEVAAFPGLEGLPVFAFRNATNYKLSDDQAEALERLIKARRQ